MNFFICREFSHASGVHCCTTDVSDRRSHVVGALLGQEMSGALEYSQFGSLDQGCKPLRLVDRKEGIGVPPQDERRNSKALQDARLVAEQRIQVLQRLRKEANGQVLQPSSRTGKDSWSYSHGPAHWFTLFEGSGSPDHFTLSFSWMFLVMVIAFALGARAWRAARRTSQT